MFPFDDDISQLKAEYQVGSTQRRRTIRQRIDIANGVHPMTRMPLADNGESCGSCVHAVARETRNRRYWKCGLVAVTFGPGTDIRLGWPACVKWGENE